MGTNRSASSVLRAALVALSAGILLSAAAVAGSPPKPCVAVIAPGNGAVLPPGKILVIGTAKGEGISRVEIDVNGKGRQSVDVTGGGFQASVLLPEGRNILRVSAGKTSASIAVTGGGREGYRYHEDVGKCASCHDHPAAGYAVRGPKEALCYRCHDRQDAGKNVHGPLGGGECTACHDPHGSMQTALVVARTETLCVTCHDQESSMEHLKKSRGKRCTECHEPHSSNKPFLGK